jgi:hypothetical protein
VQVDPEADLPRQLLPLLGVLEHAGDALVGERLEPVGLDRLAPVDAERLLDTCPLWGVPFAVGGPS